MEDDALSMGIAELYLTEQEQGALEAMVQRMGKTSDEIVHDTVQQLIAQFHSEDRLGLLRQARGMWKDRADLPSPIDLRFRSTDFFPRGARLNGLSGSSLTPDRPWGTILPVMPRSRKCHL